MRTDLQRVHTLRGVALFFLGLVFFLPTLSAQTLCSERHVGAPGQGRWQLVTSASVSGDVVRYASPGQSCEVPLQGRAVSAPQLLQDERHAVVATRDGRVITLPLQGKLGPLPQVQLEGRITAIAVSAAGAADVIAVATEGPHYLHMLDATLQSLQRLRLVDSTAKHTSSICRLLVSAPRQSFVAIFSTMAELWELSYNPLAPEIGLGMVHDFQYREGHFVPGYLNALRTALPWRVAAVGLDVDGHLVQLLAPRAAASEAVPAALVIHLDVRKPVPEAARVRAPLQRCS